MTFALFCTGFLRLVGRPLVIQLRNTDNWGMNPEQFWHLLRHFLVKFKHVRAKIFFIRLDYAKLMMPSLRGTGCLAFLISPPIGCSYSDGTFPAFQSDDRGEILTTLRSGPVGFVFQRRQQRLVTLTVCNIFCLESVRVGRLRLERVLGLLSG